RSLGALTLARGSGERRYNPHDLTFVSDLARRTAQAMDNARLDAAQFHVARTPQGSSLPTSLPRTPALDTAARYRPAAGTSDDAGDGYDLGGDFYDVFHGPTGWTVVIGDVMGKGVEAAQLTAMIRYTIRTAAMNGAPPGGLLQTLNSAMLNQRDD